MECPKCGNKLILKRIEPNRGNYKDAFVCTSGSCNFIEVSEESIGKTKISLKKKVETVYLVYFYDEKGDIIDAIGFDTEIEADNYIERNQGKDLEDCR